MARKRKPKPTGKRRNERKNVKDRFAHARDDAMRLGLIPTTPEDALTPERVDKALQSEQKIPGIDRRAVTDGWAVPDEVKGKVIERLAEPFFIRDVAVDKDGNQVVLPQDRKLLKENAQVLVLADQRQWERDHPSEAGRIKGKGDTNVNIQNNVVIDPFALYKRAIEEAATEEQDHDGLSISNVGHSRHSVGCDRLVDAEGNVHARPSPGGVGPESGDA